MSEERPETCPICHTPVVWCTCKGEKPMDEMGEELYLDEDFRMLAKTYPADVSAIGVTTLIDYVEALDAELARRDEQRQMDESNYEYEIHRRDKIITRLIALGDALIADEAVFYSQEQAEHYTVVIEEWRALMKELEC